MFRKVSVIIPCFNGISVIDRSIDSVHSQSYPYIELIVVDDGSSDESKNKILSWVSRFEQKGFILKYVFQENRGLGGAIDAGLKYVTGDYLTLLDADDYYLPESVSKKVLFLDEHPEYVGVRSNGWMIRGTEKELFIHSEEEKAITDLFDGLLFGKTNNWAGSYMIRTDALFSFYPDRNIYPSRFGQNMQILLPVAYKQKFGFIDEPLMAYVLHEDSHSQAHSPEEQYWKDEANQQGYRDIYLHMLDLILKEPEEHSRYLNIFNASYYRCAMLRAGKYQKREQLESSYQELTATGLTTLNDRIFYYHAIQSPIVYLLKIIRKAKSLLGR